MTARIPRRELATAQTVRSTGAESPTPAGAEPTAIEAAAAPPVAVSSVASLHHQHLLHQQLYPAAEIAPVIQA
jgi:hypothetical protein